MVEIEDISGPHLCPCSNSAECCAAIMDHHGLNRGVGRVSISTSIFRLFKFDISSAYATAPPVNSAARLASKGRNRRSRAYTLVQLSFVDQPPDPSSVP